MLVHLSISQFTLVEHLELELKAGMTTITGETGAGKSILLGALGLALGNRIGDNVVRKGAEKADISATFIISDKVSQWLDSHDYPIEDDTCILRRVITQEGRSRGYINGRNASATELKALANQLIDIHGQHAHQSLMQKDAPRKLLDNYAGTRSLTLKTKQAFQAWQEKLKQKNNLQEDSAEQQAQRQLLTYQVQELDNLQLVEKEVAELEAELKRLSNADAIMFSGQQALTLCADGNNDDSSSSRSNSQDSALQQVQQAIQQLDQIDDDNETLKESREFLNQAQIQLQEANDSLHDYINKVEINPQRLQQIDQRLGSIYDLARKHQVRADALYDTWQELSDKLSALNFSDDDMEELIQQVSDLEKAYLKLAQQLSKKRHKAAGKLDKEVNTHFEALALGNARLETDIKSDEQYANSSGIDHIDLLVQTNPGMPMGQLCKVASGGELSRISLAIQVITAQTSNIPSLIFDEVDVGIGGGTAERVGRLLNELGKHSQVLCVTHQPQVAAQAQNHLQVSKIAGDEQTFTNIRPLDNKQRTEEIARMLGGVEITQHTLDHAQEMLAMGNG
ncbi:DNA repair protein [Oleispira antarctica RB-8]|uniref:DNA repair protein RecN n=1 Tax=Oleispira antarctica RB-8 TaxID=698738 RepID=R4YRW7_OLEAN|nr:DNA repair protein [Oleispira antarctica RB-8]